MFNDDVLKSWVRSFFYASLENGVAAMQIKGGDKTDSDSLFYIDKKGEEKQRGENEDGNEGKDLNQSTSAGILPAEPHLVETGSRKRRLKLRGHGEKLFKYIKHELDQGNNSKKKVMMSDEAISNENDGVKLGKVDDPSSDEETSENE